MHPGLGWIVRGAAAGACCALLLAAVAVRAQDDPPGRVGRLAEVQGEVWVFEAEQGEWVAALANRPFTAGDRVATGNGSSVELRIGSTTLLLGSLAELEALRLDDQRMQFRALRGPLGLQLRADEVAAELELAQPEARLQPRRAGLYRIDRRDGHSEVTVICGELRVDGHNLALTLYPGQRVDVWRDGTLGDTRSQWLGPQFDDFALALQTLEQADPRSAAAAFVPAEMTGVEDLDRHGRWQQHPEFGAVWSPTVVAVQWAPYRHGQWVWLRPWGWTWVDAAPWGFAPFHYGRWLWWRERWCWAPGPKVARPVFAPALVGWVGGAPPGSGGRPAMGWLPLGPRDPYRPPYHATPGHLKRLNPHAPPGSLPPPAFDNRGVPGAVTAWPGSALSPRQPVDAAAQRADEMAVRRHWQAENFHFNAPGRPPSTHREYTAPRGVVPLGDPGSKPTPMPGRPPPAAAPARPPPPTAGTPAAPPGHAPFQGRPTTAATASPAQREPAPQPVAQAPVMPAAPAAPPRAQPFTPAPAAAAARNDAQEGRYQRQGADLGERRRTPESRYTPRER